MKTKIIRITLAIVLLGISSYFLLKGKSEPYSINQDDEITTNSNLETSVQVVATDLKTPWEIAFLPNGYMLVTERVGRVTIIKPESTETVEIEIEGVEETGEGGLLGAAVHPNFSDTKLLYLYLTEQTSQGLQNSIYRYTFENDKLENKQLVFYGIKGAANHDGGRIAFGPDGYLYITTGDAQNTESAQDLDSLNGKILRITSDGDFAENNPFESPIYSYGHRNPQGLAWDESGNLWATEHGPSGLGSGWDELNLIQVGKNYGWPKIKGDEQFVDMILPVIHSGASDTWAPAGLAYYNGSLFFGGLRGQALYQYIIKEDRLVEHFKGVYGRIRAVVMGPDGYLYFSTSNTDGRGSVSSGDDKILKVNPQLF